MKNNFKFAGRFPGIKAAIAGMWATAMAQPNKWLVIVLTVLSLGTGFFMRVTREKGCLLILAWTVVWIAGAMNTAFQNLAINLVKEHHPVVSKAKDLFAAAVLIALVAAIVISVILIIPQFQGGNVDSFIER